MIRKDFKIGMVASFTLTLAVATAAPLTFAIQLAGAEQPKLQITEYKVGKKTFQTSHILIHATPDRVWDILTDYNGAARTFSNVSKSKVISTAGATKHVAFSVRTVGNGHKFDYVSKLTERHPDHIAWERVSGAFKADEGNWKLEPRDGGKSTFVTYSKHIDGGFFLPAGLVKKSVRDSIGATFADLKRAAESTVSVAATSRVVTESHGIGGGVP